MKKIATLVAILGLALCARAEVVDYVTLGPVPAGPILTLPSGNGDTAVILPSGTEEAVLDPVFSLYGVGTLGSLSSLTYALRLWDELGTATASPYSGNIANLAVTPSFIDTGEKDGSGNSIFTIRFAQQGQFAFGNWSIQSSGGDALRLVTSPDGIGGVFASVDGNRVTRFPSGESTFGSIPYGLSGTVVPEPSTLATVSLGFALLVFFKRRK